jgi:ribosome biogenesis GTPase A
MSSACDHLFIAGPPLQRHYGLQEWTDEEDFMSRLAAQMGRLLKGGEPDVNSIAKLMINDWQRVRRRIGMKCMNDMCALG